MVDIELCSLGQVYFLQKFIDQKWSPGHALSTSRDLLDFQHKSENGYNFYIARENGHDDFIAVLGFIPVAHFDESLAEECDYWMAIWKADENSSQSLAGLKLMQTLQKQLVPKSLGAIGINSKVRKIYDLLKFRTGMLSHYYVANPGRQSFKIAINPLFAKNENRESSVRLLEIADVGSIPELCHPHHPKKSRSYLMNRYAAHQWYSYLFFGVYHDCDMVAVIVMRKVEAAGGCCLRIIDIVGDYNQMDFMGNDFLKIMLEFDAEYIDCLNYGIPAQIFSNWGFIEKSGDTVIPNYFEPYVPENVTVQFAYKTERSEYIIFKGDGDQDRPSIFSL